MAAVDQQQFVATDETNIDIVDAKMASTTGAEELVRSIISDTKSGRERIQGTSRGNVRVLSLTAFLFGLITAVQWYFGAVVTHSNALLADCHCMLVDALSYFLNIWAELAPPRWKRPLQLTVPGISLSVLGVLTYMSMLDAKDVIQGNAEGDDVNPWVVQSFAIAGLLFDLISIYAFWRNKQRGALPVNMLAAFMHVGADCVRSATTTVEGIMLFAKPEMNGDLIDAWSCVVITVVIFAAIVYGLYELVSDVVTYVRTGR